MSKKRPSQRGLAPNTPQPIHPQQRLASQVVQITEQFVGPLPSPNDLAQYNETLPGLAERLVTAFEGQTVHRQFLERTVILGDSRRAYLGLLCGVIVGLSFLGVAWDLAKSGHDVVAGVIAGIDMTALVAAFITGGKKRQAERETKARAVGQRQ